MFFRKKRSVLKTDLSQSNFISQKKQQRFNTASDYGPEQFQQTSNETPAEKRRKIFSQIKNLSNFSQNQKYSSKKLPSASHEKGSRQNSPFKKSRFESNHFQIQSKMSTEAHKNIRSYGISTYKGETNIDNPHHISIHLGVFKNFMLIESIDGNSAAKFIKNRYPLELIDISSKKAQNPEYQIKDYILQAITTTQSQLMQQQLNNKTNSGAFLTSVIIEEQNITISNVGNGFVLVENKKQVIQQFTTEHTTYNGQELKRLNQSGVKLYQQKIITPFEKCSESISSPLKIAPNGLNYTRVLGKAFEFKKLKHYYKQGTALSCFPDIVTIPSPNLAWIGIFSRNIKKVCSQKDISEIIKKEFRKKSKSYTEHHIAMECSFKVINSITKQYPQEAASAIIIFMKPLDFPVQEPTVKYLQSTQKKKQEGSTARLQERQRPMSLRYIGNRRSFIKNHDSVGKMKKHQSANKTLKMFT